MSPEPSAETIRATLLRLGAERAPRTFCPSEAARALTEEDWRPLMGSVRAQAGRLAAEGSVEVTQGGASVDALSARGPIRIRATGS